MLCDISITKEAVMKEIDKLKKTSLKYEVVKNVTLESRLDIFSNYLDKPQNMDVYWDVMVNMKINDYLSANFVTNLIYDNDIKMATDDTGNTLAGAEIQFKELFGVGLNVKF